MFFTAGKKKEDSELGRINPFDEGIDLPRTDMPYGGTVVTEPVFQTPPIWNQSVTPAPVKLPPVDPGQTPPIFDTTQFPVIPLGPPPPVIEQPTQPTFIQLGPPPPVIDDPPVINTPIIKVEPTYETPPIFIPTFTPEPEKKAIQTMMMTRKPRKMTQPAMETPAATPAADANDSTIFGIDSKTVLIGGGISAAVLLFALSGSAKK